MERSQKILQKIPNTHRQMQTSVLQYRLYIAKDVILVKNRMEILKFENETSNEEIKKNDLYCKRKTSNARQ